MVSIFSLSFSLSTTPFFPSKYRTLRTKNSVLFPQLPLRNPRIILPALPLSARKQLSISATEQDILQALADSDTSERSLPVVRTYENDLARLTLVGAVDFQQALTAAAADGGEAADEHIASGMPAMVVETVFPGPSDEYSTVSTRLFLPARKVKEKAKRLKSSLTEDIRSKTTSKNILAMTFRQVVLQQLWNFELVLFRPGTVRNMTDLENPREQVSASFTLTSADQWVISVLGEVVCLSALESTKDHFFDNLLTGSSSSFFRWFQKPKKIVSKDSSVIMYKLLEHEIVGNVNSLLENFNIEKANYKPTEMNLKYKWWTSSVFSKLEKSNDARFSSWFNEYVPCYRLQIDNNRLNNVKVEGWNKSAENRWEVLLTHSQMVCLTNILDMYYEDLFTLPKKQLSCGRVVKSTNFSIVKRNNAFLKMLLIAFAGGFFLITISILGQFYLPHLHNGKKYSRQSPYLESSHIDIIQQQSMESAKLEALCLSIIQKLKDAFNWSGKILAGADGDVWIGELPAYLRLGQADFSIVDPLSTVLSEESDAKTKASAQDIASYQVVLSEDGKLVGFRPTNRVAVNQWAANPLAKELYGGRILSPGFIERGLKINRPNKVLILELLISVNTNCCFALARPAKL